MGGFIVTNRFGGVGKISQRHNKSQQSSAPKKVINRTKIKKGDSIERISDGSWIESALTTNLVQVQSAKKGIIRCSGIGEGARVLAMKYAGIFEETIQLPSLRYMNNGTYGHLRWEEHLKNAGILYSAEKSIPSHPDLPLQGQFDFIVKNSQGEKYLLELKTTNSRKWNSLTEPDMMHISQWTVYSDRLGVEKGFIIYEDRDSLSPKYFPISRNNPDISLYTLNGLRVKVLENFVDNLYAKVRFAIWCVENEAFPTETCEPCQQWGCKQPEVCKKLIKTQKPISFNDWSEGLWS